MYAKLVTQSFYSVDSVAYNVHVRKSFAFCNKRAIACNIMFMCLCMQVCSMCAAVSTTEYDEVKVTSVTTFFVVADGFRNNILHKNYTKGLAVLFVWFVFYLFLRPF